MPNSGNKFFKFLFNPIKVDTYVKVSGSIHLSVIVYFAMYMNKSNKIVFTKGDASLSCEHREYAWNTCRHFVQ